MSVDAQLSPMGLEYDYIFLYDKDELTENDLHRVEENDLPLPVISCALKHIQAQIDFLQSDKDVLLVLEDDVILKKDFLNALNLAIEELCSKEPKLIHLGGEGDKVYVPYMLKKGDFFINVPMSTAECYLTNKAAAKLRVDYLQDNPIHKGADHLMQDIDIILGIKTQRLNRAYATQGSVTGDFKTLLDKSRGKHSKAYLKSRFAFTKFRRWIAAIFNK